MRRSLEEGRQSLGDRIVAAGMPGMTAHDAAQAEPEPRSAPWRRDGVLRVAGTGRIETAVRPEQRAHEPPIELDRGRSGSSASLADPLARARATLARSCGACWPARRRASRSRPGPRAAAPAGWHGSASRTTRLTRLRFTALPAARTPTARPSRAWPRPFGRAITANRPSETRQPLAMDAVELRLVGEAGFPQAAGRAARAHVSGAVAAVRPRDACGPWRGDGPAPGGRPWWPCAHGSRGSACGAGCSVDRCASCAAPFLAEFRARNNHMHWPTKGRQGYAAPGRASTAGARGGRC